MTVVLQRECGCPPSALAARCRCPDSAHPGHPLLMGAWLDRVPEHTRHETSFSGADTGSRTRDLDHGVVALYLLSHVR